MKVFLLLISLFLSGITKAATYYISPTGNDATGNGSAANPWRTLFKATSTVTAVGDIIHINAGTYTETQSSNLARGVSIEGEGMNTTIILSNMTGQWSTFLSLSSPQNTNGNQTISGVTFDGQYVSEANYKTWIGIWIGGRSNVVIHDCRIINFKDRGIIFDGNDANDPHSDPGNYATGNKFYNNTVLNCATNVGNYGAGCLNIGGQQGMEIYNNTIIQNQRVNFKNGWPIKYWDEGWLKGVKIYNNILTKAPYVGNYPGENGDWDFAIELFNIFGLEIYDNTIQGAIDLNYNYKGTYAFSAWIHNNNITHAVQNTKVEGGIILEFRTESILIENNIINNKTYGITFNTRGVNNSGGNNPAPGGTPAGGYSYLVNNVIRNNLFTNMYNGSGIGNRFAIGAISEGTDDPQINNLQIYNNTIIAATGNPIGQAIEFTSQQNGNINGLYIRNNIAQGFGGSWVLANAAPVQSNVLITHNDGYLNGNNAPSWPGATVNNNITGNPLFVGGGYFTLQAASPCIDAGINVGLPYNGTAPDMGYAEYGGASSAPTPPIVGLITQPTCTVATGSVVLSGLPASGTWTITRSPGGVTTTGTGTSTTISGLAAGTYTFTVSNASGTSAASANVVINAAPAAPAAPAVGTITQPTCTVATGSVVLSGLPASGTWTITRLPGGVTTTGTGTTTTIAALAAGTYTFTVTNAAGCTSVASANVVINAAPVAPAAPAVGTITQPTCTVATGSVVLSGLPASGTWTITRSPGGVTTTGTGTSTTISALAAGTYTFTVTNAAGCTSVASANVVINAAPVAPTAPIVGTITQPTGAGGTGSVVLSGLPASGTWTITRSPGGVTTTGTGTSTTISGLAPGTYTFTVTNAAGCISSASANVVINPGNIAPTANAGPDQTITLPTNSIILSGSGTDPDGNIVAYLWTKVSGPAAGTITNPGTAATSVTGLVQGVYLFELRVTDNNGAFGRDTMQVTVNPVGANIPPTANAGPDQNITLPTNSVILSGSGTDPDGNIVAYLWTKISGPAAGSITNPNTAATSVAGLAQGVYLFELRVTDNGGAFGRDTMQVTVNPVGANMPPTANAGPDQTITLPTNSVILSGSGTDPDGSIVAYLWTKVSGPAAGTITNPNTAATSVTGLVQGVYLFELRVTDNGGAFGRDTMQVTVNPPSSNIPPTANAGPDQTITLPTNSVTLTGSGTDPDGTVIAYLWTKISGPAAGTITNPNSGGTTVTGMVQGVYRFELRVTDNGGAFGRDTMQVTVNPASPNIPPTANAGPDQTITLPTNSVILSGTGTDPDGTVVTYLWTKISGPAATITNPSTAATSVTGLVQGVYLFELRVTDNGGAFGRDTMQVTVNPAASNIPPTANAGPDQTITLPTSSVILSGTGTDPDGTVVAYLWTKVSGPVAGTITNPGTAATSVTGLVQGVYLFELRVTDNGGAVGRDTMQVTVNPAASNIPPIANAGPDQTITLPVNFVIVSGSGTDVDGTIVAYLWTKVSGPAAGTITNPGTAATSITGLTQGIYLFELRVTDNNGANGRDTLQVTVNSAAPNIPPTANAGPDQTIILPTNSVILSGSGTDPDGMIVSYLWTKVSGPATGTIMNPGTAATSVTGLVQGIYLFELRVTDNNGATGRDTMRVTVNAAPNMSPTANAGQDQTLILPTNFTSLTGSGNDPDGSIVSYAWRQISGPSTNVLFSTNTALTYVNNLVAGTYMFELTVTDNGGATAKDTVSVLVTGVPAPAVKENDIKIYPNPVFDIATLDIKRISPDQNTLLFITDITGKNVFTKEFNSTQQNFTEKIDMRNLIKGAYLVTVYFANGDRKTLKVIKQ